MSLHRDIGDRAYVAVWLFLKNWGELFGVQKPDPVILSVAKNLFGMSYFTDREQPKSHPNGL